MAAWQGTILAHPHRPHPLAIYRGGEWLGGFLRICRTENRRLESERSKLAIGKELERERDVVVAPILINAECDYQRCNGAKAYLNSQLNKISQRLAKIQRDPLKAGVDVPKRLRELCDLTLRCGAC